MSSPDKTRWCWFFIRTPNGIRSRPLRDYDWNERVGFVIAGLALAALAVGRGLGAW